MHDILLKAFLVLETLPQDTRFVVPPKLNSFQTETLRLIGVASAQLEPYDGKQVWELETQLFAPAHFKLGYWSYWMTSKTMGHDYWYVLCEGVTNPSAPPNCDDLIVPIEKLDRTLKSAKPNLY